MTAVIKSALVDKYPDGLPVWTYAFMEGLDQLELSKTGDFITTDTKGASQAETDRVRRAVSGSTLTECDFVDTERDSDKAEKEEGSVLVKTFQEKAESNFKTVSPVRGPDRDTSVDVCCVPLQAIRLSDGKESVPFNWLAFSMMQSGRWTEARQTLCQAPLNPQLLFRLTTCYEQERDYIKAYNTMERAIQLTPDDERSPHAAHLKRLAEQARDMKENIFRGDPFEMLPLEVIINMMRMGQNMKDDFVLKSSWVSQKWRETLTQHCPELWRTVIITTTDSKNKAALSKAQTWRYRAGTQRNSVIFRDFNVSALEQLPSRFRNYVKDAKHLTISVTEEAVLERFAEKYRTSITYLESLTIKVATSWRKTYGIERSRAERLHMSHENDLCFDVISRHLRYKLQSIEIHDVSFVRRRWPADSPVDRLYIREIDSYEAWYPVLKRLTVHHCAFDNVYNASLFVGNKTQPALLKYQCDPLHRALRGAPDLEHLVVKPTWRHDGKPAMPGLGQRIELSQLRTAVLPPPSLWFIDIIAPKLTSLRFMRPEGFSAYAFDLFDESRQTPLIPRLQDSPILVETVPKLEHVEFACYEIDTKSGLEEWLPLLSSARTLTIRSIGGNAWPATTSTPPDDPDQRAAVTVVQILIDHPEWCPNLQEVNLEKCFATGDSLVQLIRTRNGQHTASIWTVSQSSRA
ncbi:hypothetical protein QFC24_006235 [Naganishia onofrii]|uniref:Uncharacterized protein n=1 Tax=Naganishia onofrii TaxID=1851511 RepID=A0ACC2X5T8_9TREE|nr:hypothetical protein QFC24_006235 [Naganishia onofrii]